MPRSTSPHEGFGHTSVYRNAQARVAWKAKDDGGYIVLFYPEAVEVYANFASAPPWASAKTATTRRWQRTFGSWRFELSEVAQKVRHYRTQQEAARAQGIEVPVNIAMESCAKFLDTIDPAHLLEVERFPHRSFQIYSAIRRCPGLFDLVCEAGETRELAGGGALAYALANLSLFKVPRPTQPLRTARRLLKRKRKEIAIALGFPAETAATAVRVLGRIPSADLGAETMRHVRTALVRGDTRTRKLLAHARRVNQAIARLVEDPRVVEWLTPPLLHDIGHGDGWQHCHAVVRLVQDTVGMLERREARMPVVRSLAELRALHDTEIERRPFDARVMAAAARRAIHAPRDYDVGSNCLIDAAPQGRHACGGYDGYAWRQPALELPTAPVRELPGQIEYVSSSQEALDAEGAEMRNCISGYGSRVAQGDCFIYRVLQPERCTLAIELDQHGRFQIFQIRTVCNGRVRRSTEQFVERWLRTHHDPAAVERVRELIARSAPAQLSRYIAADDEAAHQGEACPF